MSIKSDRLRTAGAFAAIALTAVSIVACAPQYVAPQQVKASNPSVTYTYQSDPELIQANQNAATFCSRYQSVPQTVRFGAEANGARSVVFDCVPAGPPVAQIAQANPNLSYTYRTDQELLDGSRSAQLYCSSNGQQQTVSNIGMNANGSKTATFQCTPR